MDTAVGLVSAYLQLNGYFVQTEVPILERVGAPATPRFEQTTDIDILAVRFPSSVHLGPPRESERWAGIVEVDPALESPPDRMDVVIGEVKEGEARLNPNLRTPAVLEAVLWHTGGCMERDLERVAADLVERGEAETTHCNGGTQLIRLVAFGGAPPHRPGPFHVVRLGGVLRFLRETVARNAEVFKVVDAKDPAMGMILLAGKLLPELQSREEARPSADESR